MPVEGMARRPRLKRRVRPGWIRLAHHTEVEFMRIRMTARAGVQ
jgi:hypothetical protein